MKKLRELVADTFSMTSFGFAFCSINELFFVGLDSKQWVASRGMGVLSSIVTGRPYGKYRDWFFDKCGGEIKGQYVRNALIDMTAFGTFNGPVYTAILYATGADLEQITQAVGTTTLLSPFLARPFGLYMEKVRKVAGVKNEP